MRKETKFEIKSQKQILQNLTPKPDREKQNIKVSIFSTLGEIRGWRWQLLVAPLSILNYPCHFQAPTGMHFKVAMHEPNTCSCNISR